MKKRFLTGLIGFMLALAALLGTAGDVHALAYPGWGTPLPNGGSSDRVFAQGKADGTPTSARDRIWGYTNGGCLGCTLVNGTLLLGYGSISSAAAYLNTNLDHDVIFDVRALITYKDSTVFESRKQMICCRGTSVYTVASSGGLQAIHAEGYYCIYTLFYGNFQGWTGKSYADR